ncbi:MAG: ABC transporter permease [Anaerolineae bacterium]|nr:ABC transporter permease [Anaerolineae bacterium]
MRNSSLLTSIVVSSRYIPVWVANLLLIIVILITTPATLSQTSFSTTLPLVAFLAIASMGQMLVVMTGGIDLSIPNVMTLVAMMVVGFGAGSDARLLPAIAIALGVAMLIGLVNGFLVSVLKLNPLIVTLAVSQVVRGISIEYAADVANEASVPANLSTWATGQFLGISHIFWVGIIIAVVMTLLLRYTVAGRRFQSVGANPRAAHLVGIPIKLYVVVAYVLAALLYGLAGVLLAGFISSPTLGLGASYLLAPIAAAVIGGASLTGGLASVISTCAAAFFLTLLNQMLRIQGLSSALQFVAFGIAIIGGMVVSGDRIIKGIERLMRGLSQPIGSASAEPVQ